MISSKANPLIKQARALRQAKERAATRLFLVEGIHSVGEAISAGWHIEAILYAPEKLRSEFALSLVSGFSGRVETVAAETLEYVAEKENPQGILAIVHQRRHNFGDLTSVKCGAALVTPQDPGNVGSVLRTLDAIGGDALFLLDDGVDPYHPTAIRASMGAAFWIPVIEASFQEFASWRLAAGCELIGTSGHDGQDPRDFRPTPPWLLLLGSEQKGLSSGQKGDCDVILSLPMRGRASSLNLAVAAGVLLYSLAA